MFVKLNKCDLGHVISKERVTVDPSKIEAVVEWQRPTSVHDVRSFLGLAGSYQRSVEGLSRLSPFTALTKKNFKFAWAGKCKGSFEELSHILICLITSIGL